MLKQLSIHYCHSVVRMVPTQHVETESEYYQSSMWGKPELNIKVLLRVLVRTEVLLLLTNYYWSIIFYYWHTQKWPAQPWRSSVQVTIMEDQTKETGFVWYIVNSPPPSTDPSPAFVDRSAALLDSLSSEGSEKVNGERQLVQMVSWAGLWKGLFKMPW